MISQNPPHFQHLSNYQRHVPTVQGQDNGRCYPDRHSLADSPSLINQWDRLLGTNPVGESTSNSSRLQISNHGAHLFRPALRALASTTTSRAAGPLSTVWTRRECRPELDNKAPTSPGPLVLHFPAAHDA